MEKKNISELIRNYINEIHQRDPTYFSSKSSSERNGDFKLFCEQNAKNGFNYNLHRTMFSTMLSKVSKTINLNASKNTNTTEKYRVTKGKQEGRISVKPTTPQTQQIENNQSTQQQPQTQQSGNQQTQTNQTNINHVLHPPMCLCDKCRLKRGEIQPIDPEEAGAILEIFVDLWHARNPSVQPLSQEEVLRVGKRLAPILQKHMGGDILLYGMALLSVGQVIIRRVDQSKKSKKDDVEKKRDKANEKTSETEKQKLESKEESQEESNEVIPTKRKFFNKGKIADIEKLGEAEDE